MSRSPVRISARPPASASRSRVGAEQVVGLEVDSLALTVQPNASKKARQSAHCGESWSGTSGRSAW